jgi:two-component system, NtrC family, response regulator AtoC
MSDESAFASALTTLRVITPRELPDGPSLLVVSEGRAEQRALAGDGPWVLGRDADCDVRIDDQSLSRRHATLRGGAGWTIEDLGSSNGTKVAGKALAPLERRPLEDGEVVELGLVTLVLQGLGRPGARGTAGAATEARGQGLDWLVARVAQGVITVLITGETGAGKEVLAERIHRESPRRAGPLVKINCAALPDALVESELFGHEKGAFSGAVGSRAGQIEAAHGGTVLLDEVGELPLAAQAKLLRVVEERMVQRLGATQKRTIDVRFLAATNRDLKAEVEAGRFRQDLYFRLNGLTLVVPPLRERPGEIEALASRFAAMSAAALGRPRPSLSARALSKLRAHGWPGNVRELKNVIDRAVLLSDDESLDERAIALDTPSAGPEEGSLREARANAERGAIVEALARSGGNQTAAAKLLGLSRRMLVYKLDALHIDRPRRGQ